MALSGNFSTIVFALSAALCGALGAALISRSYYGGLLKRANEALAQNRASKTQVEELLVQARRQAEFHKEELRIARRIVPKMTPREVVEAPKAFELPDVFIGAPSHGFQETQPFTGH